MSITEQILAGNVRATARLIRDIDDQVPGVREILKELHPHTGKAHVVGVTGSPGVGKSTLVDQLTARYRKDERSVGVLAVDPSSPFTGGAILGDRIRMQRHSLDRGVFIRSVATRGHFGGLSRSTYDMIDVLDAMGKDTIIVETVGVGQDEIEIAGCAHTTVLVTVPGMGDDVQAIKAGIMEIGDIYVVNKCDRPGSRRAVREILSLVELGMRRKEDAAWTPPVVETEAVRAVGVEELFQAVNEHRRSLVDNDRRELDRILERRARSQVLEVLRDEAARVLLERCAIRGESLEQMAAKVMRKESDAYSVVEELLARELC